MHQPRRSEPQRPRTAPASHRSSSLDLGPLRHALPRVPLLAQQNRNLMSSAPRQQANGELATRLVPFVQRRPSRTSTTESTGVVSLPKRPSTAEGSRISSAPTRWERPTLAESNKLFSNSGKGSRDSPALAGRKGISDTTKLTEHGGTPRVARLPPDLLCQCFTSIESLYYLVSCASVCRAWREVLLSDMVWKAMYLKWWYSMEKDESSDALATEKTRLSPQDTRTPPEGYNSWRSAFIARFQEGRKKILTREKARAVREGHLRVRPVTDTHGKRVLDCVQGDGMQKLAEHLGLSFNICLNRGRHIKIQGKGKIDIFQSSCIVRYPPSCIGNLNLSALKALEVTATSDRLLRVCPIVDLISIHTPRGDMATLDMVSTTSRSPGPLRLLQHHITSGVSVIVGTLVDEINLLDGIDGAEQVLLIVVSIHLSDLLWKLMDLGRGPSSRAARILVQDELDPDYGLHNWHVSVQLHTFGRNIWSRNFQQVFWNSRESIPGEKAVFVLLSLHEVFPGILKLPWKSEAFSGLLRGVYVLDITLWDGGGEIAWQNTSAVRIDPAPLAVVEYGIEFDGERVHTRLLDIERGVSVAIDMCIPLSIIPWQATEERSMIAITNLQVGLTSKFLQDWCGVANI